MKYLLILFLLILSGCGFSSKKAKEIPLAKFIKKCNCDTLDHMSYMGSDNKYHYFYHSIFMENESYKILKESLNVNDEFILETKEPYVFYPSKEILEPIDK